MREDAQVILAPVPESIDFVVSQLGIEEDALAQLEKWGAQEDIAKKVVRVLDNDEKRAIAEQVLISYGPSPATVEPLLLAAYNPECGQEAFDILGSYIKSDQQETVDLLLEALNDDKRHLPALDVLGEALEEIGLHKMILYAGREKVEYFMDAMAPRQVLPLLIEGLGVEAFRVYSARKLQDIYHRGCRTPTAEALTDCLVDDTLRPAARKILASLGPSQAVVTGLLEVMGDHIARPHARRLLVGYGSNAASYINLKEWGGNLGRHVKRVKDRILGRMYKENSRAHTDKHGLRRVI